jgi:hypothetical protein
MCVMVVCLFTMNGADWSKRYPRIVEEAARIKGSAVMDAEVVCLVKKGIPDFDMLHSRTADHLAVACAFDLLMQDGDDLRRQPLRERKLALSKLLLRSRGGIQYVEHSEGHDEKLFEAVCDLGLGRHRVQAPHISLSVGTVENVDQSEKSEGTSGHSRQRQYRLIRFSTVFSVPVSGRARTKTL